jgi:chorismate mutase
MATHPIYDQLVEEITDPLQRKVLDALLEHAGERVTRYALIQAVHGDKAYEWAKEHGLANSTADRQNREIIEALQAKEYPIVSSSGAAGYILAADDHETDNYLAELSSRRANLDDKISHVRHAQKWTPFIREWKATRVTVKQLNMFGGQP